MKLGNSLLIIVLLCVAVVAFPAVECKATGTCVEVNITVYFIFVVGQHSQSLKVD